MNPAAAMGNQMYPAAAEVGRRMFLATAAVDRQTWPATSAPGCRDAPFLWMPWVLIVSVFYHLAYNLDNFAEKLAFKLDNETDTSNSNPIAQSEMSLRKKRIIRSSAETFESKIIYC